MLEVKDIPQGLLNEIRLQFDADPKVGELRVRQQMLQRSGKYKEALGVAQCLDELFSKVVHEYIVLSERQVSKIDVSDMDIPTEDKERMMQMLLGCFMCADMIRSCVQDMDSILHKYDDTLHVEMFNDIMQVMRMAEGKLSYLQKNSGYLKDLVWGEKCDDMYEMLLNKAGAIMRKRKSDPNYGKNMERFYEKK